MLPPFLMIPRGIDFTTRIALEDCYSAHGEYRIITTVRHTGSHSIIEQYPGYKHWHCNPQAYDLIDSNIGRINVITTYRDPKRVAASWMNRGQLPFNGMGSPHREGCIFSWKEAWEYYGKILKVIPKENVHLMEDLKYKLYQHDDTHGAHALLDNNDMKGYYRLINKDLTDYAYECCDGGINNA